MSDIAIAMGSAFLTFVIGIMGVYVTFRPPTTEKAKLWWLASFAVCAVMGCGLVGWQTYRNGKQQESLTDSVGKIRDGLNQSETGRQVDNAYFKAKLEDAYKLNDQMRSFAPAMLKIAEANEDYTKRQFEQKSLTDKKLFDYTQNVVARIRDLGGKCKRREREILDARMQRLSTEQYKTVTPEQLQQAANELLKK